MLVLHTGLPGAGKTLNTIAEVKAWSERESRPVYYYNIKGLLLPWIEIADPLKWYTVPAKSIVVMDEAQTVFRQRHSASAVPEHVAQFETHRHLGIDVVLITQDPRLLDPNVRRLVGRHVHFVRAFGANAATRIEWNECQEDPKLNRDVAERKLVAYNKEVFNWYKSAEAHTHRFRIPPKLYVALAVPLLAALCIYFAVSQIQSIGSKDRIASTVIGKEAATATQALDGTRASSVAAKSAGQYVASYQPRLPGLPHTAPVYDEVTKATTAPIPAACVQMGKRCRCYSQQATLLPDTPVALCESIVANGYFVDWEIVKGEKAFPPASRPSDRVLEGARPPSAAVQVVQRSDAPGAGFQDVTTNPDGWSTARRRSQ